MSPFIPEITVILAFALAGTVLTITPGPDMALFVSRTINHGRRHGAAAVFGAALGILVHTALAAFGLSLLLAASPEAFFALKIAGALYLLFLAAEALRNEGGLLVKPGRRRDVSLRTSFLTGLGSNLTNPKVILFFVTFLPQFVSRTDPYAPAKMMFLSAEFLVIGVPFSLVCVLAAHRIADTLARSATIRRALNWSFAGVFTMFAGTLLFLEGQR